jgi:hypothetical protein
VTRTEFGAVFARLAVALRCTDADELTIRIYHDALSDLEPELLGWAAERLSRQVDADGAAWFPKTAEWRQMAGQIERERTDALIATLRRRPTPLCEACRDTGFARDEGANTVTPCACLPRRRDMILGRQPLPALPPAAIDPEPLSKYDAAAVYASTLARLQVVGSPIKTMPHATRARLVTADQKAALRRVIQRLTALATPAVVPEDAGSTEIPDARSSTPDHPDGGDRV